MNARLAGLLAVLLALLVSTASTPSQPVAVSNVKQAGPQAVLAPVAIDGVDAGEVRFLMFAEPGGLRVDGETLFKALGGRSSRRWWRG